METISIVLSKTFMMQAGGDPKETGLGGVKVFG